MEVKNSFFLMDWDNVFPDDFISDDIKTPFQFGMVWVMRICARHEWWLDVEFVHKKYQMITNIEYIFS